MIYKRLEKNEGLRWYETKSLANSLVMYNYKMVSSATGFTPNNAREKKNDLDVRLKLELGRKTTRKYPPIKVNDKVRLYKKKGKIDKERVPVWSENTLMLIDSRRI